MSTTPETPGTPEHGMSRRAFLTNTGVVVGTGAIIGTGAFVATSAPASSPLAAGAVAGADPVAHTLAALGQSGKVLSQPEVRTSAGGVLQTRLRVAEGEVRMGGSTVKATTYEGSYPGPTLDLRAGDTLKVALENAADEPTNLHTHGFHVSPSGNSDNVLVSIAPNTTFDYEFDLPDDHPAGTYWYHSHLHTLSDKQVFGGLFGLMIVRGELDELPGIKGLTEKIVIVSQTQIRDGAIVDGNDSDLAQQITVVNGQYQPTIEIAPGEIQRWRILNVNPTFYRLRLEGHEIHVIGYDGNALTETRKLEVLELGPGGRADVLVRGGSPGTANLESLSFESSGKFWMSMVPVPQTILRLDVTGTAVASPAALPTTLLPMKDLRNVPIDRRRTFRLEEREPRHTGQYDKYVYYINGTTFDHNVVNETMKLGATEEWEFVNLTYEPHPLHIHVNPFQVVAINGQPADENSYRDTAIIPPFGTLTIRHQFLDHTGKFVMHCHLLFHEDHGMMQLLEVVE